MAGISDTDWRFERQPEAVCSAKAWGGGVSVYAPSLIAPTGQEQSTVLSYSNISCESVNEVKRGAKKKKCCVRDRITSRQ